MLRIYTKTGDKGETSLFGGKRVSKSDLKIEVIGEIDELNSAIGVAIAEMSNIKCQISNVKKELITIQNDLFNIGSTLAKPSISNLSYLRNRIKNLEDSIDKMAKVLPRLKNFILPGGGEVGSFLHLARAVCRRTERRVVELSKKDLPAGRQEKLDENVSAYFNRLSDLLFVMARFVNFKEKQKEIVWFKK